MLLTVDLVAPSSTAPGGSAWAPAVLAHPLALIGGGFCGSLGHLCPILSFPVPLRSVLADSGCGALCSGAALPALCALSCVCAASSGSSRGVRGRGVSRFCWQGWGRT